LGLVPRKVQKVAIIGGGLMGSGIATALILSNYPVILKEVNEKFLQAGIERIKGKSNTNICTVSILPH
jgi:enoyl-CoA hydratase/3-hydroxyacyl-CoA dehydrogenase